MGVNHTTKACTVLDYLASMSNVSVESPMCLPECDLFEFTTNIRVTKFDFQSVGDQYKKDYNDAVLLILYFETFYYEKITQYHESLQDFLCK